MMRIEFKEGVDGPVGVMRWSRAVRRLPRFRQRLPTVWKRRDGRVIAIRAMDDSHLTNAILMLRRLAIHYATQSYDLALASDPSPERVLAFHGQYIALVEEAEHRSERAEYQAMMGEIW